MSSKKLWLPMDSDEDSASFMNTAFEELADLVNLFFAALDELGKKGRPL